MSPECLNPPLLGVNNPPTFSVENYVLLSNF